MTRTPTPLAEAAPRDLSRQPAPSSVGGGSAKRPWEPTLAPEVPTPDRTRVVNLMRVAVIIPMLLVVCWMLVMLDFSNIFTLAVVVIILFNMIRFAAGFSGRKTTTMAPPDRNDRWSV